DLDEAEKEIGIFHEQLDEPGSRTGSPEEALELVQRLVGVGALPQRVEQERIEALERRGQMGRVRYQRTTLEDELQVVARALGILEPGGLERGEARQAHAAARPVLARREELPERPMDGGSDRPVLRLELPGGARRRPRKAGAARQAAERLRIVRQRVCLELVEDLE